MPLVQLLQAELQFTQELFPLFLYWLLAQVRSHFPELFMNQPYLHFMQTIPLAVVFTQELQFRAAGHRVQVRLLPSA